MIDCSVTLAAAVSRDGLRQYRNLPVPPFFDLVAEQLVINKNREHKFNKIHGHIFEMPCLL